MSYIAPIKDNVIHLLSEKGYDEDLLSLIESEILEEGI